MTERLYAGLRRGLIIIVVLLLAVLIVQFLMSVIILPRLQLKRILLESTLELSDRSLLAMGGLTGEESYLSIDEGEIKSRYESSPLVRKAYVEKQFPGTLKIVLYGRSPLGLTFSETRGTPDVFDEYGVVYESPVPYLNLPVLSGVDGSEIPDSLIPFLKDLRLLQQEAPLLYSQISEINLTRQEGALYELKLYFNAYRLPVLLSTGLNETLMKKILLVLDSLKSGSQINNLEYADFRTDQVVLKTREVR